MSRTDPDFWQDTLRFADDVMRVSIGPDGAPIPGAARHLAFAHLSAEDWSKVQTAACIRYMLDKSGVGNVRDLPHHYKIEVSIRAAAADPVNFKERIAALPADYHDVAKIQQRAWAAARAMPPSLVRPGESTQAAISRLMPAVSLDKLYANGLSMLRRGVGAPFGDMSFILPLAMESARARRTDSLLPDPAGSRSYAALDMLERQCVAVLVRAMVSSFDIVDMMNAFSTGAVVERSQDAMTQCIYEFQLEARMMLVPNPRHQTRFDNAHPLVRAGADLALEFMRAPGQYSAALAASA